MEKDKPSKFEALVGKEASDKLGTYKMSTGGGTPLAKGQKLKDHPEAHRVQQPRDEDGQFTYNSANKIPLKYGPSRGTTTPPFLRGVKLTFAKKNDSKNVKSVFGDNVYKFEFSMTKEEFLESCKEYLYVKDKDGNVVEAGFKDLMDKVNKKKGKKSNLEKEMINKGQQGVVDINAEILKPGHYKAKPKKINKNKIFVKKAENKPADQKPVDSQTTQPTQPKQAAPSAPETNKETSNTGFNDTDYNLAKSNPEQFAGKYKDQLKELKSLASSKGLNLSAKLMVGLIASKKIKNFDEIKNKINSYKK